MTLLEHRHDVAVDQIARALCVALQDETPCSRCVEAADRVFVHRKQLAPLLRDLVARDVAGGQRDNRILWNERDEDIDEIVIEEVSMVHVEQVDDRRWWIGVYLDDDRYWMGDFIADSRGRMRFVEQDNSGVDWDRDEEHA